jgi:P4 family phage/plasmid primase-like protien
MDEKEITKEIEELKPQEDSETILIIILDIIETINDEIKVDKLLKKISKNSEVEISIIKRLYAKELNKTKSIRLEPSTKKILGIFSNKITLAEEFHKEQPYFYDKNKLWWLWNTTLNCYEEIDETDLLNEISKITQENTIDSKQRIEILEAMKQVGRLKVPKEQKFKFIQFKNKLIEIHPPGTFHNKECMMLEKESSPEYFITNPIPYDLSSNEETPILDNIFKEWVGENYKPLLYEIMAYSMYPDYPLNRIFFMIGSGSNGKSTFLQILARFLGKHNLCSTELELLVKNRFETAKLYKKLCCIMGETNFNQLNNTSLLKRLCSGTDLIGFEKKNKNCFDDYNYAKIIIASNSLPETTDKTPGFYRRWVIIEFNRVFSEKVDILSTIPEEEYHNLTRKCLNILKKLLEVREFTNEGTVEQRREKYEEKSNPLEKFLTDRTVIDYNAFIFKYEFTGVFKGWLRANGFREWNDTEIGRKMKEKGFEEQRKLRDDTGNYVWTWLNLRWKNSDDEVVNNEENDEKSDCKSCKSCTPSLYRDIHIGAISKQPKPLQTLTENLKKLVEEEIVLEDLSID